MPGRAPAAGKLHCLMGARSRQAALLDGNSNAVPSLPSCPRRSRKWTCLVGRPQQASCIA
eukprot:1160066-Pelagomonas_calceolata.AAC.14